MRACVCVYQDKRNKRSNVMMVRINGRFYRAVLAKQKIAVIDWMEVFRASLNNHVFFGQLEAALKNMLASRENAGTFSCLSCGYYFVVVRCCYLCCGWLAVVADFDVDHSTSILSSIAVEPASNASERMNYELVE